MKKKILALLGGTPIRKKEFKSKPHISDEDILLVTSLMKEGRFSKFVGSPIESNVKKLLRTKSRNLNWKGDGFSFLGGEYVRLFESEVSRVAAADYSISVNSATSGLTTACIALDVGPGQEVVTTPFSFTATAASIVTANAVPRFCDIDLDTFCLSSEALEKSITPETSCVMPVHWCGNAGDLDQIMTISRSNNLKVIEDAAQAPGSFYKKKALGTYGDIGVYSFNEPKNLMVGEGGVIVTNSANYAEKCRLIRNHGEAIHMETDSDEFIVNTVGYNFRLPEILAAIGVNQIKKMEYLYEIRKRNWVYLKRRLKEEMGEHLIPQKITHEESYYAYTAAFRWQSKPSGIHRNIISKALIAEGIPVAQGIPRLLCDHPMFQRKLAFGKSHFPWNSDIYKGSINYNRKDFPNARQLLDHEYLGFFQMGYPNTEEDMEDIVKAFKKIMENQKALIEYKTESSESFTLGR